MGNSGGVRAEREASELLAVVVVDGTVAGVVTQSVNPGLETHTFGNFFLEIALFSFKQTECPFV